MTNQSNDKTPPDNKTSADTAAAEKDVPKLTQKAHQKKANSADRKTNSSTNKSANKSASQPVKKPVSGNPKTAQKKPAGRSTLLLAGLAFVLAIAAGAAVYFLYQQQQRQIVENATLAERLSDVQSSVANNQQQLTKFSALDRLKQEIDAVRGDVAGAAAVRQRIEAEQQALNTALSEMSSKLGRTTVAWRLAEIEYLLIIANTRLSLERDLSTALVALQTADQKLRAIGDPVFVPVRQTIALEVTHLKGVQQPDFIGMAVSLGSLAATVDNLPLMDTQPVRVSPPALQTDPEDFQSLDWAEMPAAMWNDIRSLVVVRRIDKPVEPLLPPTEAWYLRQNLKLKLEQARLSLLRHETALFRLQLDEADKWITAYFDTESSAVKSLLASLQTLKKAELNPDLPDISDSLRVLREHMKRLGEEVETAQREGSE